MSKQFLVGGFSTPLKKIWVRQLGRKIPPYIFWKISINCCSKAPPTRFGQWSHPDHPDLSDLTTTERSGFEMPGMLGPSETLLRSRSEIYICSQFLQSKLLYVIYVKHCKTMGPSSPTYGESSLPTFLILNTPQKHPETMFWYWNWRLFKGSIWGVFQNELGIHSS